MSVEAYKTIRQEYEQYTINATWAGEEAMTYSLWLERYKRVCPEDIRMLVREIFVKELV